jgi:hypothetical protein
MKRELKRIHIDGCQCDQRLNVKSEGGKHLGYTGFLG